MKKLVIITVAILSVFFILPSISSSVYGQNSPKDGVKSASIPDSVLNIVNKSCVACHSSGGSGLASSKINFSNWDTYPDTKKAAKADDMCAILTKGKMPPKKFVSKNPDAAPTEADIKIICNWSKSLQSAKK